VEIKFQLDAREVFIAGLIACSRWEDNIKMDLQEVEGGCVD